MTPDEVRMLDNRYALLFIRGERPLMDLKYDILKHPNINYSADGEAAPYQHGVDIRSCASVFLTRDKEVLENAISLNAEEKDYVLFCEEELEDLFNLNGGNNNEKQ